MKYRAVLLHTIFFCLALILILPHIPAVSVGVSPGIMTFEDMLRSGYAEQYITVSTSSDDELLIRAEADGDIEQWVSFDPVEFTLSPKSRYRMKVMVEPPGDMPNGVYEGTITIVARAKSESVSGSGMSVGAAAAVRTSVILTDKQKQDYEVKAIVVKDTEEGHPIEFTVVVVNRGNVKVTPKIHIDLLSQDKTQVVKSLDFAEVEVLPTRTEEILIRFPTEDLKLGQYWGNVKAYLGERLVREETMTFDYLERGALSIKGTLDFVMGGAWAEVGDIVRISAGFSNIGQLSTTAKFKGEVNLDGKLVELLESEEVDVLVGETKNLTAYFKPAAEGRYEIKGVVYYSKKITDEKSTILNVLPKTVPAENQSAAREEAPAGGTDYTFFIVILVIIVVIVLFLNLRKGFSKKRRPKISR